MAEQYISFAIRANAALVRDLSLELLEEHLAELARTGARSMKQEAKRLQEEGASA